MIIKRKHSSSQSTLEVNELEKTSKCNSVCDITSKTLVPKMVCLNPTFVIMAISLFALCFVFNSSISTTATLSTSFNSSLHQYNNKCFLGSCKKLLLVSSFTPVPIITSTYRCHHSQNDSKIGKSSTLNHGNHHKITYNNMMPQLNFAIKGGGRSSSDRRRKKNNNDNNENVEDLDGSNNDISIMNKNKGFQSMNDNNSAGSRKRKKIGAAARKTRRNEGVMDMALCIIPPDEAWDNIQRARHLARDPTFYKWPPAIRLFHPFLQKRSDLVPAASSIADIIEKYNMEPFTITLDQLLILPHWEVLEANEKALKKLPHQITKTDDDGSDSSCNTPTSQSSSDSDFKSIQQLIESEEQKGLQKLKKRRMKERRKKGNSNTEDAKTIDEDDSNGKKKNKKELSPQQLLEAQREQKKEFDGPCVICLEPNQESVEHIEAVREILRKEAFADYDAFSISSSLSSSPSLPNVVIGRGNKMRSTFRAVLPIGCFSSVPKAVEVARKLQTLWEPLSFNVTDLHLVSSYGSTSSPMVPGPDKNEENFNREQFNGHITNDTPNYNANDGKISHSVEYDHEGLPILPENREYMIRKLHGTEDSGSNGNEKLLTTKGDDFGCDAMIMLMGEEDSLITGRKIENDQGGLMSNVSDSTKEEEEEILMNLVMSEAGIPGGADRTEDDNNDQFTSINDLYDDRPFSSITEKLMQNKGENNIKGDVTDWLDDDDEWEEGATIVVGRTQFFMGELRQYVGMPASSTMDAKHRILGDNVNAAARRRGAVHRQGDRWNAGDYGTKEKDTR